MLNFLRRYLIKPGGLASNSRHMNLIRFVLNTAFASLFLEGCSCHPLLPIMNSLTSWYAFSKSSLTTILSCGASPLWAKSISTLAWLSLFKMSSSLSVARLRNRSSSTSTEGGERNRNRGRGNVGWFATCLTPWCSGQRQ